MSSALPPTSMPPPSPLAEMSAHSTAFLMGSSKSANPLTTPLSSPVGEFADVSTPPTAAKTTATFTCWHSRTSVHSAGYVRCSRQCPSTQNLAVRLALGLHQERGRFVTSGRTRGLRLKIGSSRQPQPRPQRCELCEKYLTHTFCCGRHRGSWEVVSTMLACPPTRGHAGLALAAALDASQVSRTLLIQMMWASIA